MDMQIIVANPHGFCAGVDRAIEIVERALQLFGAPVYVRHAVVHNKYVVDTLRDKGAVFVEELDQIPIGSIVIFSAHGVAKSVREEAEGRRLRVYDATCPLVTKVHMEMAHYQQQGRECILVGHRGHPEVEGILGQYDCQGDLARVHMVESVADAQNVKVHDPDRLAFVTQTTLSVDDTAEISNILRQRFPNIAAPKKADICYATQNRQNAVKKLTERCDLILVVGSPSSSNTLRLLEISERADISSHLIENAQEIKHQWLDNKKSIGITAGASAPEVLVQGVIEQLQAWGAELLEEVPDKIEQLTFHLPRELAINPSQP